LRRQARFLRLQVPEIPMAQVLGHCALRPRQRERDWPLSHRHPRGSTSPLRVQTLFLLFLFPAKPKIVFVVPVQLFARSGAGILKCSPGFNAERTPRRKSREVGGC
jgi:hypothetical protein